MKFGISLYKNRKNQNQLGVKRTPLRTFREMAEEFGVSESVLRGYMGKSKLPLPKAITSSRNSCEKNSYYNPQEMREWWKLTKENHEKTA